MAQWNQMPVRVHRSALSCWVAVGTAFSCLRRADWPGGHQCGPVGTAVSPAVSEVMLRETLKFLA